MKLKSDSRINRDTNLFVHTKTSISICQQPTLKIRMTIGHEIEVIFKNSNLLAIKVFFYPIYQWLDFSIKNARCCIALLPYKLQILLSSFLHSATEGENKKTRNFIWFFRQPKHITNYKTIKFVNPKMGCCTCASEVQIEMIYADKYQYLTSFSCMFNVCIYSFVILLVFFFVCCHLQ